MGAHEASLNLFLDSGSLKRDSTDYRLVFSEHHIIRVEV